jgi:hypothetical protein
MAASREGQRSGAAADEEQAPQRAPASEERSDREERPAPQVAERTPVRSRAGAIA